MQNILLGSRNPGKLREYYELLGDLESIGGVGLLDPFKAGLTVDVEETGKTYLENARRKAQGYSEASGLITLADDSGLEVDALGGEPGILSARFTPQPKATDADRRAHLLAQLAGIQAPWPARFRCVVVIADGSDLLFMSEGVCEGEILPVERGESGFGYDPVFLIAGEGKTMAELAPPVKNQLSHRARAVGPARTFLLDYFRG
jgi:XTP/dITP diphosphohydrolase